MRLTFVLLLVIVTESLGNELSRCCAGGTRHFKTSNTCSNIKSEGSSTTCTRSASICCLRSLIDSSCDDGTDVAKREDVCRLSINVLGGGIKKECCDCCLLAKELVSRNEPCVAPTGFSAMCLRSFNKCCAGSPVVFPSIGDEKQLVEPTLLNIGDRCTVSTCEHLCHDRGGETVECSCKAGYDLAPDGVSCVDRDECSFKTSPCRRIETCINTIGGYRCQRNGLARLQNRRLARLPGMKIMRDYKPTREMKSSEEVICPMGWTPRNGQCREDECSETFACTGAHQHCSPTGMCVCDLGYFWSELTNVCEDIDECRQLMDDCLESQRCLNTPGSFKCIRTLSCGTGYAMDSTTEECIDVDECNLGSHDCGALYQCRNTQGSYRCDPKKCGDGELQNPETGECTSIQCPAGYLPKHGMCNDIDECQVEDRCGPAEECVNTPGSYRCQQKGNLCAYGYDVNKATGFCEDVNECLSDLCDGMECINLPGSYKCKCAIGFEFNDVRKKCEDIDECAKFAGHVCDLSAECINTIGSFECKCNKGFHLAPGGRRCEDVNECLTGEAKCEQKCVNIPGSYQCICDRGFALGPDGVHCEDIDECAVWAGSGNDLCMGGCVNTKGSYLCQCPSGYQIQADGRTCVDIDECKQGECAGDNRVCVNTLGSFKCHTIQCPNNYVHDSLNKNRCNRVAGTCGLPEACSKMPLFISWQFISLARAVPFSSQRPSITLFKVTAPNQPDTHVQFELQLKRVTTDRPGVLPAIRANFLLQKGEKRNSAVVTLRDSLDGPQTVELELLLRVSKFGKSLNTYVASLVVDVSAHKRHNHVNPPLIRA